MAPIISFEEFNASRMQDCLQYVVDSFQWLTADGRNLARVINDVNVTLFDGAANTIESLLVSVRSVQNAYAPINHLPTEILSLIFQSLIAYDLEVEEAERFIDKPNVNGLAVNRVCRHWRRTALSTPGFWTVIHTPTTISSDRSKASFDCFVSKSFARSGTLPLTVRYRGDILVSRALPGLFDRIIANISRVQNLVLHGISYSELHRLPLTAGQLQTLFVSNIPETYDPRNPQLLFDGWEAPRLQTLRMSGCTAWPMKTFRNLRQLIITSQVFRPSSVMSLFLALSSNPRLEDIVLKDLVFNIGDLDVFRQLARKQSPIDLPYLKQLYTSDSKWSPALLTTLISPQLFPGTDMWARYYGIHPEANLHRSAVFDDPQVPVYNLVSALSLHVAYSRIFGSTGHTGCWVDGGHTHDPANVMRHCLKTSEVRELWLDGAFDHITPVFQDMSLVTVLVLPKGDQGTIKHWFERIIQFQLFPALDELRILIQGKQDGIGPLILRFLIGRKNAGQKISTLHFLNDSAVKIDDATFFDWKRGSRKFARHVDRILFDEPRQYPMLDVSRAWDAPWPLPKRLLPRYISMLSTHSTMSENVLYVES